LGHVVGSYLILVRRAKNVDKWARFFNDLLEGQYLGMAKAFTSFLELAIELSKSFDLSQRKRRYSLSPKVVDALSPSLKKFVEKIIS